MENLRKISRGDALAIIAESSGYFMIDYTNAFGQMRTGFPVTLQQVQDIKNKYSLNGDYGPLKLATIGCTYEVIEEKPAPQKTRINPLAKTMCLALGIFLISCQGNHRIGKYKGYHVVKREYISPDYDMHVIKNEKRFKEIYTAKWFSDVYQVGDTIK